MDYRNEFGGYSGYESFDASFREQVPECKNVKLLSAYDLYISTVLPLAHKKVRYVKCILRGKRSFSKEQLQLTSLAVKHLQQHSLLYPVSFVRMQGKKVIVLSHLICDVSAAAQCYFAKMFMHMDYVISEEGGHDHVMH